MLVLRIGPCAASNYNWEANLTASPESNDGKTKANTASQYFFHSGLLTNLVAHVSNYARTRMFQSVMKLAAPDCSTTILDVGVTNDFRLDSNFFEKLYPYPNKITAVGMEDASFLERQYQGLKFVQTDGNGLPFEDKSFDLVVSFAVIEHVGNRDNQRAFVKELCRVGKAVCITTPNRWYPIEFHTVLPFVHWLPPSVFRAILSFLGKDFLSREENLNLLDAQELLKLLPARSKIATGHCRLLGPISNLLFYIETEQETKNDSDRIHSPARA